MAEYDTEAAQKHKDEVEAKIKALEEEAEKLTGKENKKLRSEKGKEVSALKNTNEYIDACKIVKGSDPVHGNFQKGGAKKEEKKEQEAKPAAAGYPGPPEEEKKEEKKDDKKKPKKQESAGISPDERKELESLKQQIIDKKKKLKEEGMSGGQMNKDSEIVAWVSRMNELKEKENPGGLQAEKDAKKSAGKKKGNLSADQEAALSEKKKAFEEYTEKLRTEFKYSKKEIQADPDYQDMQKEIKALGG